MLRDEFVRRLTTVMAELLERNRSVMLETIPDELSFAVAIFRWKQALGPGEVVFPGDAEESPQEYPVDRRRRLTTAQLVDLLWRDGRVPYRIHVTIVAVEDGRAVVETNVSGCFGPEPPLADTSGPFRSHRAPIPPWVLTWAEETPLERYSLTWQADPETARRVHEAAPDAGSPRRVRLRRLLAGRRIPQTFDEIRKLVSGHPRPDLPWRDAKEWDEAMDEAEAALADWDDSLRAAHLVRGFDGAVGPTPWIRLVRHLEVSNVEGNAFMFVAAMRSPFYAGLTSLELRRSEVDLHALADSPYVRNLSRLKFVDNDPSPSENDALVASPNLAGLRYLGFYRQYMSADLLARWLDGTPGRALRELVLGTLGVHSCYLDVLFARPELLARLRSLVLRDDHRLSLGDARRLAECTALANLHTLDLRERRPEDVLSPEALAALRAAPQFAHTRILHGTIAGGPNLAAKVG